MALNVLRTLRISISANGGFDASTGSATTGSSTEKSCRRNAVVGLVVSLSKYRNHHRKGLTKVGVEPVETPAVGKVLWWWLRQAQPPGTINI